MDSLWEPYDYPEPLMTGCKGMNRPPTDEYLHNLTHMTYHGWHYCQEILVEIDFIYPYSDWEPEINKDTRVAFKQSVEDRKPLHITLYEKDGKLIMSDDYEIYYLYRELEIVCVRAIVVGHFTKKPGVEILERPFKVKKPVSVFGLRKSRP